MATVGWPDVPVTLMVSVRGSAAAKVSWYSTWAA